MIAASAEFADRNVVLIECSAARGEGAERAGTGTP